ncbi:MAG: LLM class flavin-dependent oxidoreductase [Abditibacteriaceae bacterium]
MIRLSVLDLSPISSGSSSRQALLNTLDLAPFAESLGYTRYWLAEHHNTGLIASSSPEILIGQVSARTSTMRIGSGGVMLPNHAPLKVAENFRTLGALFPDRIDLGLGRAPGTDPRTAAALRESRDAAQFPQQLEELIAFLKDEPAAGRSIRAMPDGVEMPPLWLLGSSDFSARLAAQRGLRFAFAHHINQPMAAAALRFYQDNFQPSEFESAPRALLAVSAVCAETDDAAQELASSANLTWLRFQSGGFHESLPSVEEAKAYPYSDIELDFLNNSKGRMFVGSPATIHEQLQELAAQAGVDEIMITSLIHNHEVRKRSYELLAKGFGIANK